MKINELSKILKELYAGPSKWELDNIIYYDRLSSTRSLRDFLERIQTLQNKKDKTSCESIELKYLIELFEELDEDDVKELLVQDDDYSKDSFIESLARRSALESLTMGRLHYETLNTACKLAPNDFILCAKRTQDLMSSIQNLAVKGENLSQDVAGA